MKKIHTETKEFQLKCKMWKNAHSVPFLTKRGRRQIHICLCFQKEWKDKPKPNESGLPTGKRKGQWGENKHGSKVSLNVAPL